MKTSEKIIADLVNDGTDTIHKICATLSPDKIIHGAVSKETGIPTFKQLKGKRDIVKVYKSLTQLLNA